MGIATEPGGFKAVLEARTARLRASLDKALLATGTLIGSRGETLKHIVMEGSFGNGNGIGVGFSGDQWSCSVILCFLMV